MLPDNKASKLLINQVNKSLPQVAEDVSKIVESRVSKANKHSYKMFIGFIY